MERGERKKEREKRKVERGKRKEKRRKKYQKIGKKQYSDFLDFELRFVRFFVSSGNPYPYYAAGVFQPLGSQIRAGLYKSLQKLENQFYFVGIRYFFQQSEPCPNIFEGKLIYQEI